MGVGRPIDLLEGISRGVDLFDCVMPTRNGRNALAFTDAGPIRLRNQQHAHDREPLDPACPCLACRHSRGYLRHLFQANEMLGPMLVSHHNLTYYQRLIAEARQAIAEDRLSTYLSERRRGNGKRAVRTLPTPTDAARMTKPTESLGHSTFVIGHFLPLHPPLSVAALDLMMIAPSQLRGGSAHTRSGRFPVQIGPVCSTGFPP